MARNRTYIDASPGTVFEVLLDPHAYADWVVGSRRIRAVDPGWPAVGSRFHHAVGTEVAEIKDYSEVLEIDPPRLLVLLVKARPLGEAKVILRVTPEGGGTRIEIDEYPVGKLRWLTPFLDPVTFARNVESLRRLRRLAHKRAVGSPAS